MAYVGEDGMLGRCIRLPYHLPVPSPFYHDPILFFTMILSLYLHCELEVLKLLIQGVRLKRRCTLGFYYYWGNMKKWVLGFSDVV